MSTDETRLIAWSWFWLGISALGAIIAGAFMLKAVQISREMSVYADADGAAALPPVIPFLAISLVSALHQVRRARLSEQRSMGWFILMFCVGVCAFCLFSWGHY